MFSVDNSRNFIVDGKKVGTSIEFIRRLIAEKLVDAVLGEDGVLIKYGEKGKKSIKIDEFAFMRTGTSSDAIYDELRIKIEDLLQEKKKQSKNLSLFKQLLPAGYVPVVNRHSKMGKLVISSTAGLTVFLAALLQPKIAGEVKKPASGLDYEVDTSISTQIDNNTVKEEKPMVFSDSIQEEGESEDFIRSEFTFDDLTQGDNTKLAQTIVNCESYLDPLIERYALPYDLTYALVSQEYGVLDTTLQSNGAVGPMQIQIGAVDGERFEVPVYKNGELTGEIDYFYAVSSKSVNDPKYQGVKVLNIEDLADNFQIGCALYRRCIDKYKNIFIATDAYNKGLYAFSNAVSEEQVAYYKNNFVDFTWTSLIGDYYKSKRNDPNYVYGDPNYIWNVLRYLKRDERGCANIEYSYQGEKLKVNLVNLAQQEVLDDKQIRG